MNNRKIRAIAFSLCVSGSLLALKLTVGFISGSVAILAEAGNSFLDFCASLFTLFILREAAKPADEDHAYGHGKFENIASLFQAALIIGTGGFVIYKSIRAFTPDHRVEQFGWGIGVMVVSTLASLITAIRLRKVARETESHALMGDSIHFMGDVYSNTGVIVALILVKTTGWAYFDPALGIVVGLILLQSSFELIKHSFEDLVDRDLPEEQKSKIINIIESHGPMMLEYHNLRTRRSGSMKLIDLHLTTCRRKTLEEAHHLVDHIEQEIHNLVEHSNVLIHADPCTQEHCPGELCRLRNVNFVDEIRKQHREGLPPLSTQ